MKEKTHPGIGKIFARILLLLVTAVLLFSLAVVEAVGVLLLGPSTEARRIFTLSCEESSALKFVPRIFLREDVYEDILHPEEAEAEPFRELPYAPGAELPKEEEIPSLENTLPREETDRVFDSHGIAIDEIRGKSYKGKMMLVSNPKQVIVGTLDAYGYDKEGLFLYEFLEKYDAVGGTNAGGFDDPGGFGLGGMADGIVIRDGEIVCGSEETSYQNYLGFDEEGILHVGSGTGEEILKLGVCSGVSFTMGRTLIQDGRRYENLGGGVNPRTALGQRADGTVLLLVIEGRHPGSLGASYDDLAEEMEKYGAVNAGMLDGGSSSIMYYEGEQITRGSNIVGMRQLATCILVLPEEEK